MALFKALPQKTFTNARDVGQAIVDDLTTLGFTVYNDELLGVGDEDPAINAGRQIYANLGTELYVNFRTCGPYNLPWGSTYSEDADNPEMGYIGAVLKSGTSTANMYHNAERADEISSGYSPACAFWNVSTGGKFRTFYADDVDQLVVIMMIEVAQDKYHYLTFGKVNRARADSQFLSASLPPLSSTHLSNWTPDAVLGRTAMPLSLYNQSYPETHVMVRYPEEGLDGIQSPDPVFAYIGNIRNKTPGFRLSDHEFKRSASQLTGITVFLPIMWFIETSLGHIRKAYEFHDIFFANKLVHNHLDEVALGNDRYLILAALGNEYPDSYGTPRGNGALVLKLDPEVVV